MMSFLKRFPLCEIRLIKKPTICTWLIDLQARNTCTHPVRESFVSRFRGISVFGK
jgi:hypothetical protein